MRSIIVFLTELKIIFSNFKNAFLIGDLNVDLLADCSKHSRNVLFCVISTYCKDDIGEHIHSFTLYGLNKLPISEQSQFMYSRTLFYLKSLILLTGIVS